MRILFTAIARPSAPMHGQRLRNRALLQALHQEGHEVTLLTFASKSPSPDPELEGLCESICAVPPPRMAQPGWVDHLSRIATLLTPLPHGVTRYRSTPMRTEIAVRLASGRYDAAICDDIYLLSNFPKDDRTPLILNKHDFVHVILRRYLALEPNPAIWTYGQLECLKLRRYERRACQAAGTLMVCSDADAAVAGDLAPGTTVSVVPNAIDVATYAARPEAGSPTVLFSGSLDWRPNLDAVRFFLSRMMPLIHAALPNIRLRITGSRPSARLAASIDPSGLADFTGWVPDIRDELANAAVCVVPLRIGSGTRLKIMEAAAMQRAVVSTSVGAEGLDLRDGQEIVLADDPTDFAAAVVELLRDPARRRQLGEAARVRVQRCYGIEALRTACRGMLSSIGWREFARHQTG